MDVLSVLGVEDRSTAYWSHAQNTRNGLRRRKIDSFYVSPGLRSALATPLNAPFDSDHIPILLQLHANALAPCRATWRMDPRLATHPCIKSIAEDFGTGHLNDHKHAKLIRKIAKQIKVDKQQKHTLKNRRLALQQQLSSTREPFLLKDLWELIKVDGEIAQLEKERAASIGRMRRIHSALKGEVSITDLLHHIRTSKSAFIPYLTVEGRRIESINGMVEAATEHFANHFRSPAPIPEEHCKRFLQNFPRKITAHINEALCKPFNAEEIALQIRRMAPSKTPGIDGIPIEYYKTNVDHLSPRLAQLFNDYVAKGCLPDHLQTALLKIIPKPDKATDLLSNYRPLSMLPNQYKIMAGALAHRLKPFLPSIISPEQTGFVPGREMVDNALLLKLLYERHQEGDNLGLALFLDFKSAFDMVDHDYLIDTLCAFGFGPWFIKAIKTLLREHKARIEINDALGQPFEWTRGVFQGCPIAPLLFIIALEPLIHKINGRGIKLPGNKDLHILAAADDTVLFAQDEDALQEHLQTLKQYQEASGAQLNISKTVGLNLLHRDLTHDFGVGWLNPDSNHRYLGFSLNSTGFSPQHTFADAIKKLEQRLRLWTKTSVTIRGRVLLSKALLYSLFWYRTYIVDIPTRVKKKLETTPSGATRYTCTES